MTSAWLAWRTARRYRARTVLATIGVAVIGALLFDMLLLSHGLVDSFADLLNRTGYDIRVVNSQGLTLSRIPIQHASEVTAAIERLPEVASAARLRLERAQTATGGADVDVGLIGTTHTGARVAWTVLEGGDLPSGSADAGACPVLVTRNLAQKLSLTPGSTLPLRPSAGRESALPAVRCRVVGIADSMFSSATDNEVLTTMAGLQAIKGGADDDSAEIVLVASRGQGGAAAAVKAISAIRPDIRAYSNEDVVAQFNRNGFAYFRQISIVLSSITVVFTFLLVATILTVSTNQRLGEIAALRALGIGRRRIATMLLWESVLVVGSGGLIALPLGGLVAMELDHILRSMPGIPERLHFFLFEVDAVILHGILLAVTAIVAAAYPIWLTARLPIASTLRREVIG